MKARLTVLGSGTSMGVPTIGCDCAVCHSSDPRDRRTRPSILVELSGDHPPGPGTSVGESRAASPIADAVRYILVDTSTDLRAQALAFGVRRVDAVLYTPSH